MERMERNRIGGSGRGAAARRPVAAPTRAELGLLLMVVIWAVNFSVIKAAIGEIPPLAFNALRFPLAAAMVFLVLRRQGPLPLPERADLPRILLLGLLGNLVYQLFFIYGLDHTRAGNASLLLAGTPMITALLSSIRGHERLRPRIWLGVAGTLAGMSLVVVGGAGGLELGASTLVGDLSMVVASLAWSLYTVGARDLIEKYGSIAVTAWTLWIGTIGLFVVGLPTVLRTDLGAISPAAWLGVAYGGVLGIGLAYLLWYRGVQEVGNTRTATYGNLVPVLAVLVAWVTLGEVPTLWQVAGAIVIIGGVSLARAGGPIRSDQ
jgi:drug/metabolite transporter (DMT)-like permease